MVHEHEPTPIAIGVIETDAFCDRCGFNLHSQKVWRDGRLGVLVTRCPECGAHQAAGVRTAVTNVWLNRLALVGLLIWLVLGLCFVVGTFFMHFGIQIASSESLTTTTYETRDGKSINLDYSNNPGGPQWKLVGDVGQVDRPAIPVSQVVRRTVLVQAIGGPDPNKGQTNYYSNQIPLIAVAILGSIFILGTFIVACIAATASWFWRPGRRWLWLALPVLAGVFAFVMERASQTEQNTYSPYRNVENVGRGYYEVLLVSVMVAQIVVTAFGLIAGRPTVRFLLTVLVPPGSRQLFAFLWLCDGKTMPAKPIAPQ